MKKKNRRSALYRVARLVMLCLLFMRPLRTIGFSGRLLCMVSFTVLTLAAPVQAAEPEYTIEDLGEHQPSIIDNAGVVIFAGRCDDHNLNSHLVIRNGKKTQCISIEGLWGAFGSNSDGMILIYADIAGGYKMLLMADYGRRHISLPKPKGDVRNFEPYKLNEAGQALIVIDDTRSRIDLNHTSGFAVVELDGSSQVVKFNNRAEGDISKPESIIYHRQYVLDFNDAGQVLGYDYELRAIDYGYTITQYWVWENGKGFQNLDLGAYTKRLIVYRDRQFVSPMFTSNRSILLKLSKQDDNDNGYVQYDIPSGRIRKIEPTILSQALMSKISSSMMAASIRTEVIDGIPEFTTKFTSANVNGVIVGELDLATVNDPVLVPVVYSTDWVRPRPLQELIAYDSEWQLWRAESINDLGQIVGKGILDGKWHGFLLNPIADRKPEKTLVEYKSPPFLGLEAAVYPREPVPGLPVTFGFRIENTSQYPAAGITVDLTLADPRTEHAPRHLVPQTDFCQDLGNGKFRCTLGDMDPGEIADILFHAEMPMSGAVIWTADMESAGDIGGVVAHSGVLGTMAPPRIMDVVVISDQTRVENDVVSHPYPFGPNYRGVGESRYLLIIGHNFPQHLPSSEILDTETINYSRQHKSSNQELFAMGWQRFYDIDDMDDIDDMKAVFARAEADGYEAILVHAELKKGVLPGQHTITVSGAEGHWGLEFGDITARLSFVRILDDCSFDLLSNAYLPERIHLAVQTNIPLPLDEIPVYLNPESLGAGQTAEIVLMARRSDTGDGRLYLTEPLDLHPQGRPASLAGGTAIPVWLGNDSPVVLQARVDEDFIFRKFRIPLDPIVASVSISLTPAKGDYNWLWKDALNRAADCHSDIVIEDWNLLTLKESENIWNMIILTTSDHFPDQSVNFGQHAASILLRDMFLEITEKQLRKLEWIMGNSQAVKGLLAYMRRRLYDKGNPLLRMKIIDFDGEGEIEFRYAIRYEHWWHKLTSLAEKYGTTETAIEAWEVRATVAALGKLIEAANEALEDARDVGDCDVEELVRMTGFSFGSVGKLLKSRVVTLEETSSTSGKRHHLWRPDVTARFWIDQVAPLAAAVREQQRKSSEDTDLTLAAITFLTLPFMLSESAIVATIAFAIDLVDLGLTTVSELSQYFASEAELRFALGASVTIGEERYVEALKNAKGWASTTFGIGTSMLGAVAGGFDALPKLAALRRVARGRYVARTLEGGASIASLKPVDLQDFGAFAMSAQMRRQISGAESLSAGERRAIDIADEYRAIAKARQALPEPELSPVNAIDSFEPSAPMRFNPDADTGFAKARPPLDGRIETPRSSGDIPNARDVRVPENAHVRFMTEANIEELPLGERLGGGYTSEVFAHADDPENLAIRITYLRENAPAAVLDEFGDRALRRASVNSEHIRPVRVEQSYDVILSDVNQPEITRVMVVERVSETAQQTIARQGGRMNVAQMMAYEGALRDLNRQGLVWLDNKWDNFGFVPMNDGSGRVQVVVMDPGGIVPIRANAGLVDGLSAADIARQIQLIVNGEFATQMSKLTSNLVRIKTPMYRTAIRKDTIREYFGDMFDYEALGISGRDQLLFNPKAGEDFNPKADEKFKYIGALFEAAE